MPISDKIINLTIRKDLVTGGIYHEYKHGYFVLEIYFYEFY